MDLPGLLKRAEREKISASELSEVVRLISSGDGENLYALLRILGLAGSPAYKTTMNRYLHHASNPQVSALALKALCLWWGLTAEYRNDLISFLEGVDWDDDGYMKLQAISIAGEFLRQHQDTEVLQIIFKIYADQSARTLLRSAAYFALCRSEGAEWRELPPASRHVDFSKEVDHDIISRVQRKLGKQLN